MGLENVYTMTFCEEEALKEIELALPYFRRINDCYNYYMTIIRKAEVFLPLNKWEEAETLLDSSCFPHIFGPLTRTGLTVA
jgi:hypothetical protein